MDHPLVPAWILGVVLFVSSVLGGPGPAFAANEGPVADANFFAKILAIVSAEEDESGSASARSRRISELGEEGLPLVLDTLARGSLVDREGIERPLRADQRSVLMDAMGLCDETRLLTVLRRAADGSSDRDLRIAALCILGRHAGEEGIPLLVRVADPRGPVANLLLSEAFEDALHDMLTRSPEALPCLEKHWSSLPRSMRPPAVRAVGSAGVPATLAFLTSLSIRARGLNATILPEIGRVGHTATPVEIDVASRLLRRELEAQDHRIRQAAISAVAGLGDDRAVPGLIKLLRDAHAGVRGDALRALGRITGLSFHSDPARWEGWYAEESAWFKEQAPLIFAKLGSPGIGEAVEAIRVLLKRRLFKDPLAGELVAALDHPSPVVRTQACRALLQLGSSRALPTLASLLGDSDSGVRAAALEALVGLTGWELPGDRNAWQRALAAESRPG